MFERKINAFEIKNFQIKFEKAFYAIQEPWGLVSFQENRDGTYTVIIENNDGVFLRLRIKTVQNIKTIDELREILDIRTVWSIEDVFLDAKLLYKIGIEKIAYMIYDNYVFIFAKIDRAWEPLDVNPVFDDSLDRLIQKHLDRLKRKLIKLSGPLNIYDVNVLYTNFVSFFKVTKRAVKLEKIICENIKLLLKTEKSDPELENLKKLIAEHYADLS